MVVIINNKTNQKEFPILMSIKQDPTHVVMFLSPTIGIVLSPGKTAWKIGTKLNFNISGYEYYSGCLTLAND